MRNETIINILFEKYIVLSSTAEESRYSFRTMSKVIALLISCQVESSI
jgi:hypothetical protein